VFDASQFVQGSSATVLSIGATDEIDLTATAIDLNGTLDVSGTLTQTGVATFAARDIHSGGITIANDGQIGSVGDADSIAISSAGVVTMTQIPVFSAGLNVSGGTIAGTLATAAQANITSVGALTELDVDSININGYTISSSGGIIIDSEGSNDDITFKGTDGGVDITALYLDMSAKGTAYFNGYVNIDQDIGSGASGTTGAGAYVNVYSHTGSSNNNNPPCPVRPNPHFLELLFHQPTWQSVLLLLEEPV
jgi:hypothetical protein